MDWDDAAKPGTAQIAVGDNLERVSIDELRHRVRALRSEIERVEAEIARKQKIGAAAAAVFKD